MNIPVIRSGDLFANYSDDQQAEYFDKVASSPADAVVPEHVFGTNGWKRRLLATGADPVAASEAFRIRWDSVPPAERRNQIEANALARRYGNVENAVVTQTRNMAAYTASVISPSNPDVALAVMDNPVGLSELIQSETLGPNLMED